MFTQWARWGLAAFPVAFDAFGSLWIGQVPIAVGQLSDGEELDRIFGTSIWKAARCMDTPSCFDCLISYCHKTDPSNYIKNHQVLLSLSWDSVRIFVISWGPRWSHSCPWGDWVHSSHSVASGPPVVVGQGDPCHVASHLRSALWQGVERASCIFVFSILFNPIHPIQIYFEGCPYLGLRPSSWVVGET